MSKEINLLPDKETKNRQKDLAANAASKLVYLVLGIVVSVTAVTFGYSQYLARQLGEAEQRENNLVSILNNLKSSEILLLLSQNKARAIGQVLKDRPNFVAVLDQISALLPSGVVISDLTIKSASKGIALSGVAETSSALNTFFLTLTDKNKGGKNFDNVVIDSVTNDKALGYKFSISMIYGTQ